MVLSQSAVNGDRFEQLMLKVQATQLTGPGVMELLQIACDLQRGLVKEVYILTSPAAEVFVLIARIESSPGKHTQRS